MDYFPPERTLEKSLAISIFCLVELIPCVGIIVSYQTANIDDVGITYYVAIWRKATICWHEIVKIDIQDLDTWYSWIKIYKQKWIVIHTNNQTSRGVLKSYQLICSKKNLTTIVDIVKQKKSDIDIDAIVQHTHFDS